MGKVCGVVGTAAGGIARRAGVRRLMPGQRSGTAFLAATLLALGLGCEGERQRGTAPAESATVAFTGDWPAIKARGTIRFVRRSWNGFETLPSQGLSAEEYWRLAERFAARHGLAVEWIVAANMDELFRHLEEGRADIAVSNITVTEARKARVAFSLPLTRSREWVIGSSEDGGFALPITLPM